MNAIDTRLARPTHSEDHLFEPHFQLTNSTEFTVQSTHTEPSGLFLTTAQLQMGGSCSPQFSCTGGQR
jgi:hypothetical protein